MLVRIGKIQKEFTQQGISVLGDLQDAKSYPIKESMTNQYITVKDIQGNRYLVRINGRLWPPFTREDEQFNLEQVKNSAINSHVIANNITYGFQICLLYPEKTRFAELKSTKQQDQLKSISLSINQYHTYANFQNYFSLGHTLQSAFKRLPMPYQEKLSSHYAVMMRVIKTLNEDVKHHVSSHNDLLPSSIYVRKNKVSIVDWEYSARNHYSYDLAWLIIKSSLNIKQEEILLRAYDPQEKLDIRHYVTFMKATISFLLLTWDLPKQKANHDITNNILFWLFQQNLLMASSQTIMRSSTYPPHPSLFHSQAIKKEELSHTRLIAKL